MIIIKPHGEIFGKVQGEAAKKKKQTCGSVKTFQLVLAMGFFGGNRPPQMGKKIISNMGRIVVFCGFKFYSLFNFGGFPPKHSKSDMF